MGENIYRFVVKPLMQDDPRSISFLKDAITLGFNRISRITCVDTYDIKGSLRKTEIENLSFRLLSDSITQSVDCYQIIQNKFQDIAENSATSYSIDVALRPGVTDPVAEQIMRTSHVLGITGVEQASTGQRFLIEGSGLDDEYITQLAQRLLANATIQTFVIGSMKPNLFLSATSTGDVERISIRKMSSGELVDLSSDRRAALDLVEMQVIQNYFVRENRDITDLEFETIAQTWSEHCVHKTFRALVSIINPQAGDPHGQRNETVINNLLNTYLRSATDLIHPRWLISAFVDNAGIVEFDDQFEVSFKVETHNHPSAIEPFGGANTGVGGVIRDVIGVSARPIAATDVLCFGPSMTPIDSLPPGVLHPRRVRSGVISGIQDYGNKIGIPTVSGAILYDPGYTANPLVFCGCVGIAPTNSHPSDPLPGDRVIVLGGRTGRDGLRGATFSSMTMNAQTGTVAGASVQIGAPIVEKGLIDVIMEARDQLLYHAITDCGAGGLSSAVGEMAFEIGADIELSDVKLKYPGLSPWEIWLSEAQERMVLAVSPTVLPRLQQLCDIYTVDLTDIGSFTGSSRLVVRYKGEIHLDLENEFLHKGIPQRKLIAELPHIPEPKPAPVIHNINYAQVLVELLAHPNIASKENVVRIYDHEIQGGTIVKPFTGLMNDGPSDSVAIKPSRTNGKTAIVLGAGINVEYGKINSYLMAVSAVDEAMRNIVATGGNPDRTALLDNFCWGDPKNPQTMGTLIEANRGCYDAGVSYGAPFISGKDSLNNEYLGTDGQRHAIPPTLLISSLSVIDNIDHTTTMDLKQAGNPVYLVGNFKPHLQGSHFSLVTGITSEDGIPAMPDLAIKLYRIIHKAIGSGLISACHDLSEGGLLVSAAEMCIGGRLGLDLKLISANPTLTCFGETNGCFLVEVEVNQTNEFELLLQGYPFDRIGYVNKQPYLSFSFDSQEGQSISIDDLLTAWKTYF